MTFRFWFLLWLGCSYAQAQTTRYFGALPFWESPVQPFMGAFPLSEEEAQNKVHVAASYDDQGRLVEIALKMGEQFKDPEAALDCMYVHAERTTIDYTEDRQVHRFYNREGRRITGWGKVWEKIYLLDDRQRPVQLIFFDRTGERIENSWGLYVYHWQYQPDGSVIETRFDRQGELKTHRPGFEFKRIRMTFGPDGHLNLMQNLDDQNRLSVSPSGAAQYRYFYGPHGFFIRWEVYDEKGEPALGPTGTAGEWYRLSKNREEIFFFGKDGNVIEHASGAEAWDIQSDNRGNKLTRTFRDSHGQPKEGRFGYAILRCDWDARGLWLLGRSYLSEDGSLKNNNDGVSSEVYKRDEQGLIQEIRYYNADGQLTLNQRKKAAIERFTYDNYQTKLTTEKFDTNDQPIP